MQFPQWYVYILRSLRKDFIYVGSTDNLQRRLLQHNRGEVQSTKPFAPLMLEAYVAVHTEQKARQIPAKPVSATLLPHCPLSRCNEFLNLYANLRRLKPFPGHTSPTSLSAEVIN
jgi:putative endonuclease